MKHAHKYNGRSFEALENRLAPMIIKLVDSLERSVNQQHDNDTGGSQNKQAVLKLAKQLRKWLSGDSQLLRQRAEAVAGRANFQPVRANLVLRYFAAAPFDQAFLISDRVSGRYWLVSPLEFEMARSFARRDDTQSWQICQERLRGQFEEEVSDEEVFAAYQAFVDLGLVELSPETLVRSVLPATAYVRAAQRLGVTTRDVLKASEALQLFWQYCHSEVSLAQIYKGYQRLKATKNEDRRLLWLFHDAFYRARHDQTIELESKALPVAVRWMRVQWPLFNPDRQIGVLARWFGFVFSTWFFALSAVVAAFGLMAYAQNIHRVSAQLPTVSRNIGLLLICTLVLLVVHEYTHGVALKRYGGEVREVGLLVLMFFIPAAYCDVSDAYLLADRKQRMRVTLAGTWSTLVLASIAALFWERTVPNTTPNDLALILMTSGYATVFTNTNPLLQLDGYFFLCDYLGIDNLRDRAADYAQAYISALLTGKARPVASPREQRIFLGYFVVGAVYQVFYLFVTIGIGWLILVRGGTLLGFSVYITILYFLYLRVWAAKLRELWREAETHKLFALAAVIVLAAVAALFVPLPHQLTLPGFVRASASLPVICSASGGGALVADGTFVHAGDPILGSPKAVLRAPSDGYLRWDEQGCAAGERVGEIVPSYELVSQISEITLNDVHSPQGGSIAVGPDTMPAGDLHLRIAAQADQQSSPLFLRVGIIAPPANAATFKEGNVGIFRFRTQSRTTLWRKLWAEQWDKVLLDLWKIF